MDPSLSPSGLWKRLCMLTCIIFARRWSQAREPFVARIRLPRWLGALVQMGHVCPLPHRIWNGSPHRQHQRRLGGVPVGGPGTDTVCPVLQQSTRVHGQSRLPELTLLACRRSSSPWATWPGPHTKQEPLSWPPLSSLLHSHSVPVPHEGTTGGQAISPDL